jgi:hypothetical protein
VINSNQNTGKRNLKIDKTDETELRNVLCILFLIRYLQQIVKKKFHNSDVSKFNVGTAGQSVTGTIIFFMRFLYNRRMLYSLNYTHKEYV